MRQCADEAEQLGEGAWFLLGEAFVYANEGAEKVQ